MQISVELLVKQLQQIPGIRVTIEHDFPTQNPVFSTFAIHWLETYKLGKVKANTYRSTYYEPIMLHLIPYFKCTELQEITPDHVQAFFNEMESKFSLETLIKIKNCLNGIFASAVENGLCGKSPMTKLLQLSSQIPPQEKHTWNAAEYEIAWQFAKRHDHGLDILVLMETGITRSELLGLTFNDVDIAGRCLNIRNGLVQAINPYSGTTELIHSGLKNGHRSRQIPISSELTIEVARKPRVVYVGKRKFTPGFLFYSPRGLAYSPRNWYDRVFCRFMTDLCGEYPEIPRLTTHELRHTRASLLANDHVDVYAISKLLGHSDLEMLSKRYLHRDTESLRTSLNVN